MPAVDDPEVQRQGLFRSRFRVRVNDDFAMLRELDSVTHQIQENLPQAAGVAQDGVG